MNHEWSDQRIVQEIGQRLRQERLNQNLTQAVVGREAGLRTATISNVERGKDFSLSTLVAVLRVLDRLENLEAFLPDPGVSPMQLLRERGNARQRATGREGRSNEAAMSSWAWGES